MKRFLPRQGANREEQGAGWGRGRGTVLELSEEGVSVRRGGSPGLSFLTPSSPCRSLDPPGAGRVRAYRGEPLLNLGIDSTFMTIAIIGHDKALSVCTM